MSDFQGANSPSAKGGSAKEQAGNGQSDCDQSINALIELKEALRRQALAVGFDVVGFAPASPPPHAEKLPAWLEGGAHGEMAWMARDPHRRMDPRILMPGLGAVMVLGVNHKPREDIRARLTEPGAMGVAAYALGLDYHDVLKKRLRTLAAWLEERLGRRVDGRLFVDTAPVLERPLAAVSGIGWQGKNTQLVSKRFGCWLFLAEYFLAPPLPPDPVEPDHCGDCRACIDACPTRALDRPYHLAAVDCLAYYTIEFPGPIPLFFREAMGRRVFGCDDCVAACPFNRFAPAANDPDFLPREALTAPRLVPFAALDDAAFRRLFRKSPLKRMGVVRFLRNLAVGLGHWDDPESRSALGRLMEHEAPLVRAHAAWGLGRLGEIDALHAARRRERDAGCLVEIERGLSMYDANRTPGRKI